MRFDKLKTNVSYCNRYWVPIYWTDYGWCTGGDYENCPRYSDEDLENAEVLEYSTIGNFTEARLNLE